MALSVAYIFTLILASNSNGNDLSNSSINPSCRYMNNDNPQDLDPIRCNIRGRVTRINNHVMAKNGCNYFGKNVCPLSGQCMIENVVYKCNVVTLCLYKLFFKSEPVLTQPCIIFQIMT